MDIQKINQYKSAFEQIAKAVKDENMTGTRSLSYRNCQGNKRKKIRAMDYDSSFGAPLALLWRSFGAPLVVL